MDFNFTGIIIGICSFLIIGMFHPIVIKAEYYFGKKIWPLFALVGVAMLLCSFLISNNLVSTLLGILACSLFWSILELFQQEKRVEKGWFPKNPKRKKK
ncbi:MAG: DUF4491 family protein [Paludibacteraceae bacterium]|jgi:hypothetical protein|nr:DUF4491 family protein [Paludibacteraceae bacterium]MCR5298658.1 DUF4491 family protein [Paludibacteraceae bacterium]